MIFKDYYKILGLQSNKVNMAQIKAAYREQAKKYHPDVNIANARSEERFKDINEAYRVLSDINSKKKYDRTWNRNVGRKNTTYQKKKKESITEDFMNIFFGNVEDKKHSVKSYKVNGENIDTSADISIKDAFNGKEQTIGLKTANGNVKKIKVQVPAGIQNNEKIRVQGQGKPGKNGGKPGDLYIKIKIIDDEKYSLDGYNVRTDLCLTPWEAALSTKVTVQGLNEEILVYVPAGIQSGEKIEIENKGYCDRLGNRGKLILDTKIMIPKNLKDEEKELFKKLNNMSSFNPRNI